MQLLDDEYDFLVKTLLIGEPGVGKSSFCTKLNSGDFLNTYNSVASEEYSEEDDANDYISLLQKCIKLVSPNTNWSNLFMDTTFKNIISDCENISLKIFF